MSEKHVVTQGVCISSIAREHGFAWETLWGLPENAELRKQRKDPNVLLEGDEVFIPDLRSKVEAGATETRHRFRRKGEPSVLRMCILDHGEPLADKQFVLQIDGKLTSGTTDSDGGICVPIPGNARQGEFLIGKHRYHLKLGWIDPISEVSGIQLRLNNLRYGCQPTGQLDPQTIEALNQFRRGAGLPESSSIDEDTLTALERCHDDMQGQTEDEVDNDVADIEQEDADLKPDDPDPSEDELV